MRLEHDIVCIDCLCVLICSTGDVLCSDMYCERKNDYLLVFGIMHH